MRGVKSREVIAFIIGVLLRYGSKGNNRVMASGEKASEADHRCQSNCRRLDQLVGQRPLAELTHEPFLLIGL
jgi:hypothetical protein